MSDDGKNNVSLDTIHALLLGHGTQLGRLDGRLGGIDARLESLVSEVATVRQGYVQQGMALGQLQATCLQRGQTCGARLKRISEDVQRVGDDTGRIQLVEVQRRVRWSTIAKVGGAIVALVATVAGVVAILQLWR